MQARHNIRIKRNFHGLLAPVPAVPSAGDAASGAADGLAAPLGAAVPSGAADVPAEDAAADGVNNPPRRNGADFAPAMRFAELCRPALTFVPRSVYNL